MKTSIAMATYDGGAFLAEQLASLARQTQLPDELIVTDDRSSDNTYEILSAFAASAPFPVRVARNSTRLGYTRNFIKAANLCNGEIIFFADQDDVWRPHKIARVMNALQQTKADTVFHDIELFSASDHGKCIPSYYRYLSDLRFSAAASVKGCSIAVRRGFVDYWGWPETTSPISYDLWIALLATAFDTRHYVDEVLVDHRLHERNASGWIASNEDRLWIAADAPDVSDTELLIDLCLKRWNLAGHRSFLEIARGEGMKLDAGRARAFIQLLELNLGRYNAPEGPDRDLLDAGRGFHSFLQRLTRGRKKR